MRILYLYEEVMGYTVATIRALVRRGAEIHVVHWDHGKLTPYRHPDLDHVHMYARSTMSEAAMAELATAVSPALTVVSGWNDRGYLAVAGRLRRKGRTVVVALDGQWRGTIRQHIASAIARAGFFRRYFTHAWVPGARQFEYARRLGFDAGHIAFDLYCADLALFDAARTATDHVRGEAHPRRFLYVGRFEPVKGLDVLLQAWSLLEDRRRGWELTLVGHGSLRSELENKVGIQVRDFLQPGELLHEMSAAGCFVLPSRLEPWGVVVHEAAAAGLPLVLSDSVGAGSTFLIPGLNGYRFASGDARDLARRLADICAANDGALRAMSSHSRSLSQRITPDTSAANVVSFAPARDG